MVKELAEIGEIKTGLEETVDKFKLIILGYIDNRKNIPSDIFNSYFRIKDRDLELYVQERERRKEELLAKKQTNYQLINVIS